jgi:hypothetical protein
MSTLYQAHTAKRRCTMHAMIKRDQPRRATPEKGADPILGCFRGQQRDVHLRMLPGRISDELNPYSFSSGETFLALVRSTVAVVLN